MVRDVVYQLREGNRSIVGLMVESFLEAGNQPASADPSTLKYGLSVTDPCLGWDTTRDMIRDAAASLKTTIAARRSR